MTTTSSSTSSTGTPPSPAISSTNPTTTLNANSVQAAVLPTIITAMDQWIQAAVQQQTAGLIRLTISPMSASGPRSPTEYLRPCRRTAGMSSTSLALAHVPTSTPRTQTPVLKPARRYQVLFRYFDQKYVSKKSEFIELAEFLQNSVPPRYLKRYGCQHITVG